MVDSSESGGDSYHCQKLHLVLFAVTSHRCIQAARQSPERFRRIQRVFRTSSKIVSRIRPVVRARMCLATVSKSTEPQIFVLLFKMASRSSGEMNLGGESLASADFVHRAEK